MREQGFSFAHDTGGTVPMLPWYRGVLAVAVSLSLLVAFSFDLPFLKDNAAAAATFFSSFQFLYFVLAAVGLSSRRLSGRWYELAIFVLAALYLYLFYGDYLLLVHMSGDSVCQVSYWNILFRPHLTGSIGVAFAKPGQVVILGLLNELSLLGGHIVFKIGLCLIMAACVWSLTAVACELGGKTAGALAFFLTLWAFETDFVFSGSAIYANTTLFSGLRFYYYHPRWKWLGRLLLVMALQFRIEAVAVVAVVWVICLARREWREAVTIALWSLVSLLLFVGIIYRIQGSLARLNSGAAAGYVAPVMGGGGAITASARNPFSYIAAVAREDFTHFHYIRFLLIVTLAGLAGAVTFDRLPYVSVFGSLLIVLANVFLLGGTFNLERYCDLVYAFACSIGAGSLVRYGELAIRHGKKYALAGVAVTVVLLLAVLDYSRLISYRDLDPESTSGAFTSAMAMIANQQLPAGARLMSEDDLLSHVVVIAPDRYSRLTALQYFNVASEEQRREILANTDFIWFDLTGFLYYYLYHLPKEEWRSDPFRLQVQAVLENRIQAFSLYGVRFVPVELEFTYLLLKVEH